MCIPRDPEGAERGGACDAGRVPEREERGMMAVKSNPQRPSRRADDALPPSSRLARGRQGFEAQRRRRPNGIETFFLSRSVSAFASDDGGRDAGPPRPSRRASRS